MLLHPVLGVARGSDGALQQVGGPDSAPRRESFFHAEVANLAPSPELQQQLSDRLRSLVIVTADYPAMRERIAAIAADVRDTRSGMPPWDEERDELAAFLAWLGDKSFVYLGYREYDVRGAAEVRDAAVRVGRGLGLLRDDARSRYGAARPMPADVARRLDRPPLWLVSKTHGSSPVHRAAPMDDIVIKELDRAGTVVGVRRLIGLFTAKGYADPPSEIPILRRRLAAILSREGVVEDSHDYRDLVATFNSLPREHLLAADPSDIHQLVLAIRTADARSGMQLLCRPDALWRGLLTTVLVPRARFSTELHGQVSTAVRRHLRAAVLHEHLALDDRPVARLHYYCAVPPEVLAQPPIEPLQIELDSLLRTWDDELRDMLARTGSQPDADRLATRYTRALPISYKASTLVADAARDVRLLEALSTTGAAQIDIVTTERGRSSRALKMYLANEPLVLSEFVPVLENLGLRVLGQDVVELALPDVRSANIHTFAVEPADARGDLQHATPLLVAALHAVRAGAIESDRLNTLIVNAGLEARAVDLVRAYVEHARQVGVGSRLTLTEAVTANPASARALFEYFAARFDPAVPLSLAERQSGPVAEAQARFVAGLDGVQSLAHDRVLRALAADIAATVRTNFYGAPAGAAIALKLDCSRLQNMPAPRPAIETWVHARQMEGVHLRGGRVARGGIRASDRPDDFRTEVLGLMRTQIVKNAVIVPVGAKGGFIVKGQPRGVPADRQRIEAAYRLYIEALLSITDNLDDGHAVAPHGQIVYDESDPYLVVAADKGTAMLSDVANQIAVQRGFWLDDAFASGGHNGYDHKRLAITARGAWECARQHFREMGRDLERETVSVAGIGDMSGDVFGNGLLRSRRLRLLAAFNHREIFLDPDPDPELSYQERARLFHLPGSGWRDYAAASLSRGGGVYERAAKSIVLSPEARALLGLDASDASGEDVVRAILRLPVDLLWNGGVGTYVKAADERHVDVGDPANDTVRVDARELRAAVIAEGGNLGLTQRARIEYALAGGRINTDAIDNSGGVDLSDHEVNLKIALQPLFRAGTLSEDARVALLAELADPICNAVLAHNRSQARALGTDQIRSRSQLAAFSDLITILESEAGLDRLAANLPTREALRARRGVFLGLTRPELAVLMAHAKLDLQSRLLDSPLCDEPDLETYLRGYFPAVVCERYPAAVSGHPLRRQIIAVSLANDLIDSMGATFLVRAVRDTGRDVLDVVRAWAAASAVVDVADLRRQLDAQRERLTAEVAQRLALELPAALERAALWLVQRQPSATPLHDIVERFHEPVATILAGWVDRLTPERRAAHAATVSGLVAAGLDAALAERLALLGHSGEALEIANIARTADVPLPVGADAYAGTSALVDLDWPGRVLPSALPSDEGWEPRAAASLLEALVDVRRHLTLRVLAARSGGAVADGMEAFAAAHHEQLNIVNELLGDLKAAPQPTLPGLIVLIRELGRLARPPET